MFDWNDVRLFLAVARSGSTRAAAQEMGLAQTTVARRMEVLEHDLGLRLFERSTRGHQLTAQGQALAEAAAPMREAAEAVARRAEALGRSFAGTIRITAAEVVFSHLVAPIVAEFRRGRPEVQIEYDSSEGFVDLAAGEADLAFRAIVAPTDERLVGQKLTEVAWAVYCSRAYAEAHGMPRGIEEVRHHAVVSFSGPVGRRPGDLWFMSHVDPARIAGSSNTVSNITGVLRAGIGVGCLPCFHADAEPALLRCFAPPPEMTTAIWLLSTPERRRAPLVEAFIKLAALRFRDLRPRMRGEGVPLAAR